MDLPVNLDLHRVVFVQVGLSTLASASVAPSYNLPIHLYGLYNIEGDLNNAPGATEGLRQYSILLVVTFALDLIWMYNWSNTTSALPFILILIGLVIKPISLLTCLNQLNRTGNGFGGTGLNHQPRQTPFLGLNSSNTGAGIHQQTPSWATSPSSHQYRSSPQPPPPGPSSVSHQAIAAHEFAIDNHDADAQNLSDEEVLKAKKELDFRIAQKKQQLQQQQQQHPNTAGSNPHLPPKIIDGSGYHTLE